MGTHHLGRLSPFGIIILKWCIRYGDVKWFYFDQDIDQRQWTFGSHVERAISLTSPGANTQNVIYLNILRAIES